MYFKILLGGRYQISMVYMITKIVIFYDVVLFFMFGFFFQKNDLNKIKMLHVFSTKTHRIIQYQEKRSVLDGCFYI